VGGRDGRAAVRGRGVRIAGSGNVVHNLRLADARAGEEGTDWNHRFDNAVRDVVTGDPGELLGLADHVDYHLAVPTPDHYYPMLYIAGLAAALVVFPPGPAAAGTPAPGPSPKLPTKPRHGELQVEVNRLGQVVRVLHGNLSGDAPFDTMAMGNALQMWIRDQHGKTVTAVVGLYKVRYDYDPKTQKVKRTFALFKRGGNWANEPGAATKIVSDAKKEAQATAAALAKLKADQQKKNAQNPNLPDINAALKRSRATPTPSPHP